FVEQVGAEAAAPDRLEELLGNDLVGVDVGAVERCDQAGVGGEGIHWKGREWGMGNGERGTGGKDPGNRLDVIPYSLFPIPCSSRTSTKCPATAAAAAIA